MTEPATGVLAEPLPLPEPLPPERRLPPREWARANLASSPWNLALTIVAGLAVAWVVFRLARWAFVTADWTVVRVNLKLFMVGFFPVDELWRLWVASYVVVAAIGVAAGAIAASVRRPLEAGRAAAGPAGGPGRRAGGRTGRRTLTILHRFWPAVLGVVAVLSFTRTPLPALGTAGLVVVAWLAGMAGARTPPALRRWAVVLVVAAFFVALQVIISGGKGTGWDDWGGLHLVVSATVAGIALAFPLGLLLALGRRSSLPAIRMVSVGYVEAIRAVPLVTLLFLGQYMIGFMFPNTVDPPSFLVRAVIAITLFEAAYIAEIVRGGLQAVPRGQIEAAQAIGLSPVKVMRLVVLPQALRAVIPAMVGQFISLFKDTSLLAIVGFFELLDVANAVTQQDAFRGQGLRPLTLAFVGLIYWAGCSTMSRESQRLERRLGVGER
jgi:general L-amino acid transport system permease protein